MTEREHALVLSGGGAFAAYEVGVLKALVSGDSPATDLTAVDPHIVTGTSAGSYNGALFVSRWAMDPLEAVADMERIWLTEVATHACGSGVFRWRGNPLNFFDLRCFLQSPPRFLWRRVDDLAFFSRNMLERSVHFFQAEGSIEERFLDLLSFSNLISTYPFPGLIRRTVDFREIRRSDVRFQAIATNWDSGELREFHNDDLDEDRGPLIIMASSAIPGLFPPVPIPPHVFVDGGVLMNTPLAPAIHAGATDLHVIYLDPEISQIPPPELQTTLATLQRTLAILWAGVFDRDIRDAERINLGIELYERSVGRGELTTRGARTFGRVAGVIADLEAGRKLRKLTIHRYHPHDLLGGALGVLDFSADQSRSLIDRGYRDAVNHDCEECGCVLPSGGSGEAPS